MLEVYDEQRCNASNAMARDVELLKVSSGRGFVQALTVYLWTMRRRRCWTGDRDRPACHLVKAGSEEYMAIANPFLEDMPGGHRS